MRDFTWHVFTRTGDIEAYLLFKEMNELGSSGAEPEPSSSFGEEAFEGDAPNA